MFTRDRQAEISPRDAIALLREGNQRFTDGRSINCDLMQQVRETAQQQSPFAAILGCMDARVPPEIVFDQRIGDIFCTRIAGNFANTDILGSLEYATEAAGAKAIIVLGHTSCGAIKGALDNVKLGNLTSLLENFDPAIAALDPGERSHDAGSAKLVTKVAINNARLTAKSLTTRSSILAKRVDEGQLTIVAAMHDVATGKISWLE